MDRADWGKMLFYSLCLGESVGFFATDTLPITETFFVLAVLGIALPFVVGYLVADLGPVYGFALGIAPAMFAIFALPSGFLGFPPVAGVGMLLVVSLFLSALSGLVGQRLALWRDAA